MIAGVSSPNDAAVLRYVDPVEDLSCYLALCGLDQPLSVGGLRIQPGVDAMEVAALARVMQLKGRVLGIGVNGAKAAIDMDPAHPGKHGVLRRFLDFLRPHLETRLSLGPDMGLTWSELERAARSVGMVSTKAAVARTQGLPDDEFQARLRLLDVPVRGMTLGERRAGHGLAHASVAAMQRIDWSGDCRVAVQGFGTLGRGAAVALEEAGVRIVAVADERGCLVRRAGVDVVRLLSLPQGASVTVDPPPSHDVLPRDAVFDVSADLIVLAACDDGMTEDDMVRFRGRCVAVGANLGLSEAVESLLHDHGVVVVPDVIGGCGGSASMNALFGPSRRPTAQDVLNRTARSSASLVAAMLDRSRRAEITPRQALMQLCCEHPLTRQRPYGGGPIAGPSSLPLDGRRPLSSQRAPISSRAASSKTMSSLAAAVGDEPTARTP